MNPRSAAPEGGTSGRGNFGNGGTRDRLRLAAPWGNQTHCCEYGIRLRDYSSPFYPTCHKCRSWAALGRAVQEFRRAVP